MAFVSACGDDFSTTTRDAAPAVESYTIGGNVSGLTGSLVLQNNGADDLTLTSDGAFTFVTDIDAGSDYAVTVLTQSAGQTCTVSMGMGIATAAVSSVVINCVIATYSIGGMLTGLSGGNVVLQNNGGDNLTLTSDGAFTFATNINAGEKFEVTVLSTTTDQHCTVTNGIGTIAMTTSSVDVTCRSPRIIFNTQQLFSANLGGVAGADALCNAATNKPNVSVYKAFIVDSTTRRACTTANCSGGVAEGLNWVLQPFTDYRRPDAVLVGTTDGNAILPFPLANAAEALADGSWTGLNQDWTSSSANCDNWTSTATGLFGRLGDMTATDSLFLEVSDVPCLNSTYFLFCVEQ